MVKQPLSATSGKNLIAKMKKYRKKEEKYTKKYYWTIKNYKLYQIRVEIGNITRYNINIEGSKPLKKRTYIKDKSYIIIKRC